MCYFVLLNFFAFPCLFGIADTRLFFPDRPADTWQLHDGFVLGILAPAREALNSRSASAKVSSDSFASTLCEYLRSNHSFVKDVKQDRRRKSVRNARGGGRWPADQVGAQLISGKAFGAYMRSYMLFRNK
jgi:hypothetical protein